MKTAPRWWYLLRYHRPTQIFHRATALAHRQLFPLLPHGRYSAAPSTGIARRRNSGFDAIVARHLQYRADCRFRARGLSDVLNDEYEFLNERRTLRMPIDWTLKTVAPVSALWRFHLHYHEFLLDMLASSEGGGADAKARLWAIVHDWIRANPIDRSGALTDAWHPFCLSKRIAVWLMLWHAGNPPTEICDRFAASLEAQTRYLERHLEWDLRGNHLWENLRTLALAGAFFEGRVSERRLEMAEQLLTAQFTEQVLPGGEHFERSPMYHAQMLSAVLDVRDAVCEILPAFSAHCADVAARMSAIFDVVTHPDGGVASLSDTALSETPPVGVLQAAANGSGKPEQSMRSDASAPVRIVGSYWRWQDDADCVVFDAGPVGADELPAHAHCDLLGFEASIDGQRLFVDSGVYDYDDSEMRRYCRSTAAHNVLQVDGVEQCDVWSRFRMGYRGRPSALEFGQEESFDWSRATHDAYRRIGVPTVGRWLACRRGGPWFCIDWAEGAGVHQLVQRLHLAPEITWTVQSSHTVGIQVGNRSLTVRSLTVRSLTTEIMRDRGWYCPDFGVRREAPVLSMSTSAELPACLGWMMHDAQESHAATLTLGSDGRLELLWRNGDTELRLYPKLAAGERA